MLMPFQFGQICSRPKLHKENWAEWKNEIKVYQTYCLLDTFSCICLAGA